RCLGGWGVRGGGTVGLHPPRRWRRLDSVLGSGAAARASLPALPGLPALAASARSLLPRLRVDPERVGAREWTCPADLVGDRPPARAPRLEGPRALRGPARGMRGRRADDRWAGPRHARRAPHGHAARGRLRAVAGRGSRPAVATGLAGQAVAASPAPIRSTKFSQ